ncbi:MAG: ABC transporter permease [Sphingopyxis sp. RIFCSPHIGHO2_01_FULL_65_24]|nr:MAG: ABC transporter permease [Sphingopyxis sp. RIFCSPHIGHO2_01_FULL_65_24]
MNFRNISAWSIRNPVPPIVLFVLLLLAGLVSFNRMDVNDNPDIEFPAVQVIVVQPGAAPTELETQVTQRVEAAVRGVSGVDEMSSYVSEGNSRTMVQFAIGTPIDRAYNDVNQAISQIRSDLPDGILEPQVVRVDIAGGPITYFAVEATDMTLEQLSWFVDNTVAKDLLSIPGMSQVRRSGGVDREIRVILDPARMQSYGVTASQINQQLRQVNVNAAGGRTEIAGSEQAVRVLGNAGSANQLGDYQLSLGNGRTIRLSDVATVSDGYAEQRNLAKIEGRQVLSFAIEKAKGASDVTVHDETMKKLEEIKKNNPKVNFKILFTRTEYTKEQYRSSMLAMIEGAVLAVVVVFLFLRDWRATLISALAIPLSAIPTFWFMDMMGFSLNSLSLLALSLVAGVLVDDAIVEIENIVRHMRMGKTAYQASIDAADEIGLAVVATTMSIVAVFLPVALMPGISGQFFIQFGMTVVFAVLMSLAVARMITPMIAAYFLSAQGEQAHAEGPMLDRYEKILRWTLDESKAKASRDRVRARGGRGIGRRIFLDHRVWIVGIGVGAFLLSIVIGRMIPMQFQPTINSDYSQISYELPPGSTLAQSETISNQINAILSKDKTVENAFYDVGVGSGGVYITLKKERPQKSVEWERALQPKLSAIPDARVRFQSQSGGFSGRDITMVIGGDDPVALEKHARQIVNEMGKLKELRAPRIEGDIPRPEIIVNPRMDLAADLGVTTAALSQTIRIATLGDIDQNAAKFSLSDRQIPIRVLLSEESRRSLATLENLPVPTTRGTTVPLKSVAELSFGAGPTELRRYNQTRRVVIGADLAPGLVTGEAQKKIDALPGVKTMPQGIRKVVQGDAKWQAELLTNFVIAVVSGLLLVFATLVLLYRRFVSPLVNMSSLLLAPLGGLIGLLVTGMEISMPVFIGLLMLFGIVAKNSILLVDFALEEMDKGMPKHAALIEAGHKRAQPIVMTTVAMVAGMVPTALSLSGDGAWRAPMGVVVIGGLILSTMLTLLIVPAGFSLADSIEKRLGRFFSRNLLTYKPGDDTKPHSIPSEPHPAE